MTIRRKVKAKEGLKFEVPTVKCGTNRGALGRLWKTTKMSRDIAIWAVLGLCSGGMLLLSREWSGEFGYLKVN